MADEARSPQPFKRGSVHDVRTVLPLEKAVETKEKKNVGDMEPQVRLFLELGIGLPVISLVLILLYQLLFPLHLTWYNLTLATFFVALPFEVAWGVLNLVRDSYRSEIKKLREEKISYELEIENLKQKLEASEELEKMKQAMEVFKG